MKNTLYTLALLFAFASCNGQTTQTGSQAETIGNITITDRSNYSEAFIDGLKDAEVKVRLEENYMLFDGEKVVFPTILPLNEEVTFKGKSEGNTYVLTVKRETLTSVAYRFQLQNQNKQILDKQEGKASLGSFFFFASETDEDPETGFSYPVTEYAYATENCWFSVRIGDERDEQGKLLAKIISGCEDNKHEITLENAPILRSE